MLGENVLEALSSKSRLYRLKGLRIFGNPVFVTRHLNELLKSDNFDPYFRMDLIVYNKNFISLMNNESLILIDKSRYLQDMKVLNLDGNKIIDGEGYGKLRET